MSTETRKSNFTIASSGWLSIVSSVWSLVTVTSPVALFGSTHGGVVAVVYNATFAGTLGAMGLALVLRKPWALSATIAATVSYTLDKMETIFDEAARKASLGEASALLADLGPAVEQTLVIMAWVFLFAWWSFAAYLYAKRDYFGERPASS